MEEKALASCSSSAAAAATSATGSGVPCSPPPADDFSAFLHHFLLRSSASSSSSSSHAHRDPHPHQLHSLFLPTDNIHRLPPSADGIPASDSYFPAGSGPHAPSSSLGASGNDTDDYDCESEEGLEALLEDTPARLNPPRSSSKRSRTAEVHNLSEKRRRSRINEKMKALQSLIPNSNKTDKASMLDEAIEYLKQLQLQVQMLSMRNGLTLHPMCMPGVLQPVQIPQMRALFGEETENLLTNMTGHSVPINQETQPQQTTFSSPDQRTANEPHVTNMFGSGSSFGLESSLQIQPGPYQLNSSSEEICREDMLRLRQSNVDHPETSLFGGPSRYAYSLSKSEYEAGARAAVSLPFGSQPSTNVKLSGRDQPQG